MFLFDIFKKRKQTGKIEAKKQKKAPAVKAVREEILAPAVPPKKKIPGSAYGILYFPHVTEKATDLSKKNKYVFKVWRKANKPQIKKAVENHYGVNVVGVRIINIKGKKIRLGRQEGMKKGYKKAIVKVAEGQKIEVLPR